MTIERSWLLGGLFWVIFVFYLSLGNISAPINIDGIDKIYHLLTYLFLSLWFLQIIKNTKWVLAVTFGLILMGIAIEFLQAQTPYRMFEYADMLANAIGAITGWMLSHTILGKALQIALPNKTIHYL